MLDCFMGYVSVKSGHPYVGQPSTLCRIRVRCPIPFRLPGRQPIEVGRPEARISPADSVTDPLILLASRITFVPESNNRRTALGGEVVEELGAVHAMPAPQPTAKAVALFGQSVGLPVDGLLLYSACHRSCLPVLRGERGACTLQTAVSRENECFGWESYVIPTCQNRGHR